jgi:pilus assembly protein CpaB
MLAGMACVAMLARGMASSKPRPVAAAPAIAHPVVQVLVAKRDLAVGDRIDVPDVGWQDWPVESTNAAYFVSAGAPVAPNQNLASAASHIADAAQKAVAGPGSGAMAAVIGDLVRSPILTGEPILKSRLVHAGSAGVMAVTLDAGKRAMALPLTVESAVGGFILPGDHVDVVMSRQIDTPQTLTGAASKQVIANVVLSNVRVLAIDQSNTSPQKLAAQVGATATVEVSPDQADQLVAAKAMGQLTLVLRSYADAGGPATSGSDSPAGAGVGNVVRVFSPGESSFVTVAQ